MKSFKPSNRSPCSSGCSRANRFLCLLRVDFQELDEEPENRRPELGCDLDRRAGRRVAGRMRLHEDCAVAEDERRSQASADGAGHQVPESPTHADEGSNERHAQEDEREACQRFHPGAGVAHADAHVGGTDQHDGRAAAGENHWAPAVLFANHSDHRSAEETRHQDPGHEEPEQEVDVEIGMLSQIGDRHAEPDVGDGAEDHCAELPVPSKSCAAGEDKHAESEQSVDLSEKGHALHCGYLQG